MSMISLREIIAFADNLKTFGFQIINLEMLRISKLTILINLYFHNYY